jgi:hypothetical protein
MNTNVYRQFWLLETLRRFREALALDYAMPLPPEHRKPKDPKRR